MPTCTSNRNKSWGDNAAKNLHETITRAAKEKKKGQKGICKLQICGVDFCKAKRTKKNFKKPLEWDAHAFHVRTLAQTSGLDRTQENKTLIASKHDIKLLG